MMCLEMEHVQGVASIFQSVNESELRVSGESVTRCSESVHELW